MTLIDKIEFFRDKLNNSLLNNDDYDRIYKLSTLLDELILEYYKEVEFQR